MIKLIKKKAKKDDVAELEAKLGEAREKALAKAIAIEAEITAAKTVEAEVVEDDDYDPSELFVKFKGNKGDNMVEFSHTKKLKNKMKENPFALGLYYFF